MTFLAYLDTLVVPTLLLLLLLMMWRRGVMFAGATTTVVDVRFERRRQRRRQVVYEVEPVDAAGQQPRHARFNRVHCTLILTRFFCKQPNRSIANKF